MLKADGVSKDVPTGKDGSMLVERERLTLRERATDILRQAIIDQRFPAGAHLKEKELCALLGVSRTSVREALRHLESEQLIKTVPHRGPVVISLSAQDGRELYQVRAALEGLAGELFATNASDQHITALREAADEMAIAAKSDDPAVTLATIARFYAVLFDGAQNRVCAEFIQSLNARISMLRRMSLSSENRSVTMMQEIERIVAAAVSRDGEELKRACIAHVEGARAAAMPRLLASDEPTQITDTTNHQ